MSSKVSFTIRRPTSSGAPSLTSIPSNPTDRRTGSFTPHAVDSSDEDDQGDAAELVTAFDQSGAQRLYEKPKPSGPLVIPALANRDWRAVARARKQQHFIPDGAAAPTGKDGSQGGLGTRDTINSGPQVAGIVKREAIKEDVTDDSVKTNASVGDLLRMNTAEETEDERARKAILAGAMGGDADQNGINLDIIPLGGDERPPLDETDAYKQDVVTRPESATLEDYERVPVSQFGAALLRGMGWKEGTAASRTRRGLVEPWLPTSRPALLGIGAKERPTEDIPTTGKMGKTVKRPERRYVPVVKLERQLSDRPPSSRSRSRSPNRSGTSSRLASKSASPYPVDIRNTDQSRRGRDRDRDREYGEYDQDRSARAGDRTRKYRDYGERELDRRKARDGKNNDRGYIREREHEVSGRQERADVSRRDRGSRV